MLRLKKDNLFYLVNVEYLSILIVIHKLIKIISLILYDDNLKVYEPRYHMLKEFYRVIRF